MSESMKFKIAGKTYDAAGIDQISLRDVVTFNSQAEDIGLGVTWHDVERISAELADLTDTDEPHPQALVMFAVTVWASRRVAGEDVSLSDALDVPMSSIEMVERKVPKDRQPKKGSKPRKVSVPATGLADQPVLATDLTTLPTSTEPSANV